MLVSQEHLDQILNRVSVPLPRSLNRGNIYEIERFIPRKWLRDQLKAEYLMNGWPEDTSWNSKTWTASNMSYPASQIGYYWQMWDFEASSNARIQLPTWINTNRDNFCASIWFNAESVNNWGLNYLFDLRGEVEEKLFYNDFNQTEKLQYETWDWSSNTSVLMDFWSWLVSTWVYVLLWYDGTNMYMKSLTTDFSSTASASTPATASWTSYLWINTWASSSSDYDWLMTLVRFYEAQLDPIEELILWYEWLTLLH